MKVQCTTTDARDQRLVGQSTLSDCEQELCHREDHQGAPWCTAVEWRTCSVVMRRAEFSRSGCDLTDIRPSCYDEPAHECRTSGHNSLKRNALDVSHARSRGPARGTVRSTNCR